MTIFSRLTLTLIALLVLITACQDNYREGLLQKPAYKTWNNYLGDAGRTHFSALTQINKENVKQLEVAWEYHTGDPDPKAFIQCSPIIVDSVLYAASPKLKIFAVNAATGEELWQFDPFAGTTNRSFTRGVAYWTNGKEKRILFSAGRYLYSLNALNGQPDTKFGDNGKVALASGLGRDIGKLEYQYHTPGTIYQNLIIMGSLNAESLPSAPGHIRAFDIRTGKVQWVFHTIPQPGEEGFESWEDSTAYKFIGGANNWAGMALDEERGLVFIPTGSAAFDFYGGNRKGDNLFANCLLALEAATGKLRWYFQGVHHDIWDRDFPAPPTLVSVMHEGKMVDAVAQITKSGHTYVFERETGESLFPIEEKAYPTSDLQGEQTSPTQPLPVSPPPFARQHFAENDINPYSQQKDSLLAVFKKLKKGGQFTPPSTEGTLILPGLDGGGEWGGAAYDPASRKLYVNANEMAWVLKMIDNQPAEAKNLLTAGKNLYQTHCASCHGSDLKGSTFHGEAPALVNIQATMNQENIEKQITQGKGAMPAFSFLKEAQVSAITGYLLQDSTLIQSADAQQKTNPTDLPYSFAGYTRFADQDGYPAIKPPWGTLNAIDLDKGTISWQVPLGEFDTLSAQGIPVTGTENYGGPIVTAGGLVFVAATKDQYIRAFDKDTGEELWKHALPAAGMATPCTYEIDGTQYIVIAAGGGKPTKKKSDTYIAFALPH